MKYFHFLITILFVSSIFIIPVSATTRYVSTTGDNGNMGTLDSPYLTIQYGVNQTIAGDTLYIRSGSYNERVILYNTGTLSNPILISNYTNELIVLNGVGTSFSQGNGLIEIANINYTTVNGFNITNSPGSGIRIGHNSTNITISNNSCVGTIYYACIRTGWFNETYNITIQDNTVQRTNSSGGIYSEQISLSGVIGGVVKGNTLLYNFLGEDIVIKDNSTNIKVFNNHCNDEKTVTCIYVGTAGQVPYAHDIEIYNNNISTSRNGNAIALNTENGGHAENITIFNNILTNSMAGIRIGYYAIQPSVLSNVTIINNIFRNNSMANVELALDGDVNLTDIVIRNNILLSNTGYVPWKHIYVRGSNVHNLTVDNNLFNRSGQNVYTGCTNCITADPLLEDVRNNSYVLNVSSPAINAGNKVRISKTDYFGNKRLSGTGVDIGIYEFPFWNVSGYVYSTSNNIINDAEVFIANTNNSYFNVVNTSNGIYNFSYIVPDDYYVFAKYDNESSQNSSVFSLDSDMWQNITTINTYNTILGSSVSIDLSSTINLEGDNLTFTNNRTDLFSDFNTTTGRGNWTPANGSIYSIKFGVSNDIGFTNITILFNVTIVPVPTPTPITPETIFRSTCASNTTIYVSTLQIFSILVMLLGFVAILVQLNGNSINPFIIISSIIIIIVAFGMLLTGNYLIYAIIEVTRC